MKRLDETEQQQPVTGGEGEEKDPTGIETGVGLEGQAGEPISACKDGDRKPKRPKGSSITLTGFGKRDGSDVNNSLSLVDFYNIMLGVKS